jgi:beta-glucanase (GH16 family)
MACRTADSLRPGAAGLTIATVPAAHCHARWSMGQIVSRKVFPFGYFEAYMRIAGGAGIDNAFWLTTEGGTSDGSGDEFEIDIVEAMYPNDVHMTLHRHNLQRHHDIGEIIPSALVKVNFAW